MASYQEILKQIDQLTKEAEKIRESELSAAIADIKAKMAQYGIKVSDIVGKEPGPRSVGKRAATGSKKKVAPKYRGSNGELWTGRGRRPAWVEAELGKGKSMEDLAI
jgi:DNA-binding protein H-NS